MTLSAPSHTPIPRQASRKSSNDGGSGKNTGKRRKYGPRTLVIAASAWMLAVIFIAPYLEMIITALRPADELRDRTYLPTSFEWNNLVDVWKESTLGDNLQVTLLIAGGATLLVLLVS
ncbi:carbohydrate ABC transporter permease, partial [Streptomyces sp. NPDC004134]